ncbi:hypothetical protein E2C01_039566 [Portunus trituberculatus]|uniref:Uncharacterized protein n=1 Tax=Portunus trituberculatus TaxID=210409 RepID=A0A5B7FDZ0_PORTR|nr:hypothetical protein [Portunus trituberculatus]
MGSWLTNHRDKDRHPLRHTYRQTAKHSNRQTKCIAPNQSLANPPASQPERAITSRRPNLPPLSLSARAEETSETGKIETRSGKGWRCEGREGFRRGEEHCSGRNVTPAAGHEHRPQKYQKHQQGIASSSPRPFRSLNTRPSKPPDLPSPGIPWHLAPRLSTPRQASL